MNSIDEKNPLATGAATVIGTLLEQGVNVCFGNPGTSEMHFVAGLEAAPKMRCVLGLFEGVVTGAADGYARMTDRPAATLMHLGPGLANGLANLHNAKRANSPVVNIVGEHATWHKSADSPLTSDIEGLARPMSHWVGTVDSPEKVEAMTREAVNTAVDRPGHISTLIVPADISWMRVPQRAYVAAAKSLCDGAGNDHLVRQAATALTSGRRGMLIVGGRALRADPLNSAARIASHTGVGVLAPYGNARMERGAGRVEISRITPVAAQGPAQFKECEFVVLAGAPVPVAMFGYPGQASRYLPETCEVIDLNQAGADLTLVLEELEALVGATRQVVTVASHAVRPLPQGELSADKVLQAVAALMPDDAIVVDESISAGRKFFSFTDGCPPYDFLALTGGSIGIGLPLATGAAIACPSRKVINMEGDGSAMYTVQALWTQAREKLDVITIIFANRGYQILRNELVNVGVNAIGASAERMLTMADPEVNWVDLARGLGVDGARVHTCSALLQVLRSAISNRGPFLIEARIG